MMALIYLTIFTLVLSLGVPSVLAQDFNFNLSDIKGNSSFEMSIVCHQSSFIYTVCTLGQMTFYYALLKFHGVTCCGCEPSAQRPVVTSGAVPSAAD